MDKRGMDISFTKWKVLKKMSLLLSSRDSYTLTEICRTINIDKSNPIFNELVSFLFSEEIIILERIVGKTKVVKINIGKLDKFMESTVVWEEFAEYVRSKKLIYANI